MLFNKKTDHITRKILESKEKSARVGVEAFTHLDFVDNVVLMADKCLVFDGMIRKMESETLSFGINISTKVT